MWWRVRPSASLVSVFQKKKHWDWIFNFPAWRKYVSDCHITSPSLTLRSTESPPFFCWCWSHGKTLTAYIKAWLIIAEIKQHNPSSGSCALTTTASVSESSRRNVPVVLSVTLLPPHGQSVTSQTVNIFNQLNKSSWNIKRTILMEAPREESSRSAMQRMWNVL